MERSQVSEERYGFDATIKTTMMITLHVYCRCKLCKLTDHYNSIHIP